MRYELLEPNGDCIEIFDCRDKAVESLVGLAVLDPDSAVRVEIIEIDDDLGETHGSIEIDPDLFG